MRGIVSAAQATYYNHQPSNKTSTKPTHHPPQVGSAQRIATMQMKEADSGKKGKKRGAGGGDEDEGARGFMAGGGKKGRR